MKPELRKLVYDKYNGCCAYCGCEMTFKEMQVDHLVSKLIFSLKSTSMVNMQETYLFYFS